MHLQVCDILSSLFFIFFLILVVTTFLKNNQPSVCFLLLRCDSGFGLSLVLVSVSGCLVIGSTTTATIFQITRTSHIQSSGIMKLGRCHLYLPMRPNLLDC